MYWIIEFSRKEEKVVIWKKQATDLDFNTCVFILAHAETFMKKDKPFWLAGQQVKTKE